MDRPPWLDEQPEILDLLHAFVDKLDAKPAQEWKRAPSIKVEPGRLGGLFRHDEAADLQWALLKSLAESIVEISPPTRRTPFAPEYDGARVRLRAGAEPVLRRWLERDREPSYAEQWRAVVRQHGLPAALAERPARIGGKTAGQVAQAFARIAELAPLGLTLRQLSARCFWGHSKFLDSREALLRSLWPDLRLRARPVLVHVRTVAEAAGILFIENQDTYVRALDGHPRDTQTLTLVYAAGFRGSAERIRGREGVSLHYAAGSSAPGQFEAWWFGRSQQVPVWFWGDLDFAGMAILRALRARFGAVAAWRPGYEALLAVLDAGGGHAPGSGAAGEQIDPGRTGCAFADEVLLPAIRARGAFVDQETL